MTRKITNLLCLVATLLQFQTRAEAVLCVTTTYGPTRSVSCSDVIATDWPAILHFFSGTITDITIVGGTVNVIPGNAFSTAILSDTYSEDCSLKIQKLGLEDFEHDAFGGSNFETNLEVLDLQHNRLKRVPKAVGNLKGLRSLNLNDNELTSLPEFLMLLPLRFADFNNNNIGCELSQYIHLFQGVTFMYWPNFYLQCPCDMILALINNPMPKMIMTYYTKSVENATITPTVKCNLDSNPSIAGLNMDEIFMKAGEVKNECTNSWTELNNSCIDASIEPTLSSLTTAESDEEEDGGKCDCVQLGSVYSVQCQNVTDFTPGHCLSQTVVKIYIVNGTITSISSRYFQPIVIANPSSFDTEILIQHVGLESIDDDGFAGSNIEKNLKSLDLQHNRLKLVPFAISKLTSLKSLNLNDNLITAIPTFLKLLPLTMGDFNNNPIKCQFLQYLDTIGSLTLVYWPEMYMNCTCDVILRLLDDPDPKLIMTYFSKSLEDAQFVPLVKCDMSSDPSVAGLNMEEISTWMDTVKQGCNSHGDSTGNTVQPCEVDDVYSTLKPDTTEKTEKPSSSHGFRIQLTSTLISLSFAICLVVH